MEKQNITLSLPKDLLARVKHIAIDKNTSISGLLTQTLEEIVCRDDAYRRAKERQLALLEEGFAMGFKGGEEWERRDLYDRK